ncbi:DUF6377 domain-containing protein [Neolewinella persica]|uniref:DUF6377 domain-containing protein n=1 Tax=Neolewinella persica TaxID=70998 RepID=UPI00036DD5CC|nr:DUF6377 domain-containing protein [Neolewinella persica]
MKLLREVLICCLLCCLPATGATQLDSLLNVLDTELEQRNTYLAQKEAQLQQLDQQRRQATSLEEKFEITLEKVAALESFSFTRASKEVCRLDSIARQLADPRKIDLAQLKESFIFLSAGMFNEAIDSLHTIDLNNFNSRLKAEYYASLARCYIDLSDNYPSSVLSGHSRNQAATYLDSAILYVAPDTIEYLSLLVNKAVAEHNPEAGIRVYHQICKHPDATVRLMAKEHGGAAINYRLLNRNDSARIAVVKSAIADERTVTREAISLVRVARYAYEIGDYERSGRYIKIGLENANFFGAQHRKIEVLEILPLIEEERQQLLRSQRKQFIIFSSLLSILLLLAIWLIRRTIHQNQELKERRQALLNTYQQLRQNNTALRESERIKEQYIGHFFQTNTKFITTAKKVIDKATKAIYAADFKEAKFQLKSFNAKQQNKQLLRDFDQVFLTLFPNFVPKFHALFPSDQIWQDDEQEELSTEIRIFALMRLGIKNNDTISKILGYSVNTIYAYRSKVRGKSLLEKDAFDQAVMNISSTKAPEE